MVKKFVLKMLEENKEQVDEYLKDENTIFSEYFTQEQLDRIKKFALEHVNFTDSDIRILTGIYGEYSGYTKEECQFYIVLDYMEFYAHWIAENDLTMKFNRFKKMYVDNSK